PACLGLSGRVLPLLVWWAPAPNPWRMWTAAVYRGSLAGGEQSATTSAPERERDSSSVIAGAAVVNPRIAHEQPPCERRAPAMNAPPTRIPSSRTDSRSLYGWDVQVAIVPWSYFGPPVRGSFMGPTSHCG